tara:strand:+ start:1439 stop:2686 length:1248 start_codon:yes stop_codon:yes gene_type:complete
MNIIKVKSYLLYLLPIILLTGPFLTDLSISFIALLFILSCFFYDNKKYFQNSFVLLLFGWCIILQFSSLLSNHVLLSLESSLFYFRYILFSLGVWFVLDNDQKFLKNFSYCFLFTFIFVIFDSYLQYFTGYNIFGFYYDGYRLSGVFNEESILGTYIARLLPFFFALIIVSFSQYKFYLYCSVAVLLLADTLVLLSGERTALFLTILGSALIILLISKFRYIRLIAFMISMCLAALILHFDEDVNSRVIKDTIVETQIFQDDKKIFSEGHELLFQTGISMFYDNPIIGIGPKNYREVCKYEKYYIHVQTKTSLIKNCSTHPHNMYIQLLSETGILGTLPVLLFLFSIIFIVIKHISRIYFFGIKKSKLSDFQLCLIVSIFLTLWPLAPSMNIFNNWISVIYFLPLGFLFYSFNKD